MRPVRLLLSTVHSVGEAMGEVLGEVLGVASVGEGGVGEGLEAPMASMVGQVEGLLLVAVFPTVGMDRTVM